MCVCVCVSLCAHAHIHGTCARQRERETERERERERERETEGRHRGEKRTREGTHVLGQNLLAESVEQFCLDRVGHACSPEWFDGLHNVIDSQVVLAPCPHKVCKSIQNLLVNSAVLIVTTTLLVNVTVLNQQCHSFTEQASEAKSFISIEHGTCQITFIQLLINTYSCGKCKIITATSH